MTKKAVMTLAALAWLALGVACGGDDDGGNGGGGTSGMGGMMGGDQFTGACAGAAGMDAAALHAAAAGVLTPESPCGFASCHIGMGKAGLVLQGATDLRTLLVGVASCEVPAMPLIDGAGGEAALANSWLWQKMDAEADASSNIVANPAWVAGTGCGTLPSAPFGTRMPQVGTPDKTSEARLAAVRNWICAGAPGP